VGDFETVLRTTNGGEDWKLHRYDMNSAGLRSVHFVDTNTGWAVGGRGVYGNGTILHTTNGGLSSVVENKLDEIPREFSLLQNFPNPFNPSTKIRYSIAQQSNVLIRVFDILGNEIETLVNEEKTTGIYEITWYAENLPSGIYFYRLQAGSFNKTKKMLLLK
jgi:hypothetical protein